MSATQWFYVALLVLCIPVLVWSIVQLVRNW